MDNSLLFPSSGHIFHSEMGNGKAVKNANQYATDITHIVL